MKCLVTSQGTAAAETGLCNKCFLSYINQSYARKMASQTDDVDPTSVFIDCSKNDAIGCCVCGYGNEVQYGKIESWRIVLEDEHGQVIEFGTDIPLSVSNSIDEMIRETYETTF